MGSALEALVVRHPEQFACIQHYLYTWAPLHYLLSNAATSIAAADREDLAAADVDHLAPASEDPQPLAVDLDLVARVEEAVGRKGARGVQVAEGCRERPATESSAAPMPARVRSGRTSLSY